MRPTLRHVAVIVGATALVGVAPALAALAAASVVVTQKDRMFAPGEISVAAGDVVRFSNDDPFIHQIYVSSPSFSFDSDGQAPGQPLDVRFTAAGDFQVLCGIHPKMALSVHVR